MRSIIVEALLVLLVMLGSACSEEAAPTSEAEQKDRENLGRYRDILYRKPHHAYALEKLFQAYVDENEVKELVGEYARAVKKNPEDTSFRVILARLHVRTDEPARALRLLRQVAEPDHEVLQLLGSIELAQGNVDEAVAALAKAAEEAPRRRARQVYGELGAALLAAERRDEGVAAFRKILELSPDKEAAHTQLASVFARHGLFEEAHAEYDALLASAGDDPEKRCMVIRDLGTLLEREGRDADAIQVYRDAMQLVLRGNWLRDELATRIIAAAKRSLSLEALVAEVRGRLQAEGTLEDYEFLAAIHLAEGAAEAAVEVLSEAVSAFPDDLDLSAELRLALRKLGNFPELSTEFQRILERHPDNVPIYVDFARFLAGTDRIDDAVGLWRQAMQKNLASADVALQVSDLFAAYGENQHAVEVLEHALALAPARLDVATRMAQRLLATGDDTRAVEVLRRMVDAAVEASGPAQARGAAISAARVLREGERTVEAIDFAQQAVDAQGHPDDQLLLAELRRENGEDDLAIETLAVLVATDEDRARRNRALRLFIAIHDGRGTLDSLVDSVPAADAGVGSLLIAGEAYRRLHRPEEAQDVYRRLLESDPAAHAARQSLAEVLVELGDLSLAAEEYEHLVLSDPAKKIEHLTSLARVQVARGDLRAANAAFDRISREAGKNAKVFADLAEELVRIERYERAVDNLRQAVRLEPKDAELRTKLARLLVDRGRDQEAIAEFEVAIENERDAAKREGIREALYEAITKSGALEDAKRRYEDRIESNPYDAQSPAILAYLYSKELEFDLAQQMVDRALLYASEDSRLRRMRASILREISDFDGAIADLEAVRRAGESDPEIQRELGICYFLKGDQERAMELWERIPDPLRAGETLAEYDLVDEAIELYRTAIRRTPGDDKAYKALGKLLAKRGDVEAEAAVYEQALEEIPADEELVRPLVSYYLERGKRERAAQLAEELFVVAGRAPLTPGRGGNSVDPYQSVIGTLSRQGFRKELGDILLRRSIAERPDHRLALHAADFLLDELDRLQDGVALCRDMISRPPGLRRLRDLEMANVDEYRSRWIGKLRQFFGKDYELRRRRYDELTARMDAGEAKAIDFLEAAVIADASEEVERQASVLERATSALAGTDEAISFLSQLGLVYSAAGHFERAVSTYEEILRLLAGQPDEELDDKEKERSVQRFLRRNFGAYGQVSPEEIAAYHDIISLHNPGEQRTGNYPTRPRRTAVVLAQGQALVSAGDLDNARSVFLEAVASDAAPLGDLAAVASALDGAGLREEAYSTGLRAIARLTDLERLPYGVLIRRARRDPLRRIEELGVEMLKAAGERVRAYDLLRDQVDESSCRNFLRESVSPEDVTAHYQSIMDEHREAVLEETDPTLVAQTIDELPPAWKEYVRAGVRRAEVYYLLGRYEEASAAFAEVLEVAPDDIRLIDAASLCDDLRDDYASAIAKQRLILDLLAGSAREESQLVLAQKEHLTAPLVAGLAQTGRNRYSGGRIYMSSFSSYTWTRYGWRNNSPANPHVLAVARLMVKLEQAAEAVEWLRQLVEEGTRITADEDVLGNFAPDVEPGDLIPLYRTVVAKHPTEFARHLEFAEVLIRAGRHEEAITVYERVRERLTGTLYDATTYRQVEDALFRLRGENRDEEIAIERAELAEKLEKNPRDVARRVKLIHLAAAELDLDAAYELAVEGRKLLPFRKEFLGLVQVLARSRGEVQLEIDTARAQFDQTTGWERPQSCIALAKALLSPGAAGEDEAVLAGRRAEARRLLLEVSAAADVYRKGELASLLLWAGWAEDAAAVLRGVVEDASLSVWQRSEVLGPCVAAIREAEGDEPATDALLELLQDPEMLRSWDAGDLLRQLYADEPSRDRLLARVGARLAEVEARAAATSDVATVGEGGADPDEDDAAGDDSEVPPSVARSRWLRLLASICDEFARPEQAEAALERLLSYERGNVEVMFDLVDRHLGAGDLDRAEELARVLVDALRLVEDHGKPGDNEPEEVDAGRSLNRGEHKLLQILEARGDREGVRELIQVTHDPNVPRTALTYSRLLARYDFDDEAVAARLRYIESLGDGARARELQDYAELLVQVERPEAALEVFLQSEDKAGNMRALRTARAQIDALLAELGRDQERIDRLRRRLAENDANLDARKQLARLLCASGDFAGATLQHRLVLETDPADSQSRSFLMEAAVLERDAAAVGVHLAERKKRESRDAANFKRLEGCLAWLEDEPEKAFKLWERAVAGKERWAYTLLEHAGRCLDLGNPELARDVIEREAKRPKGTWWWWNDNRVVLAMARMHVLFGEHRTAQKLLDQRLQEDQLANVDAVQRLERFAIQRELGDTPMPPRTSEEARARAEAASASAGEDPDQDEEGGEDPVARADDLVSYGLGRIFERDYEPAREALRAALELEDDHRVASDGLIALARRTGDVELEREVLATSIDVLGKKLVAESLLTQGNNAWRFPRRVNESIEGDWRFAKGYPTLPASLRGYKVQALFRAEQAGDRAESDRLLAELFRQAGHESLEGGDGLFAYADMLLELGRTEEAKAMRPQLMGALAAATWWQRWRLTRWLVAFDGKLGDEGALVDTSLHALRESFENQRFAYQVALYSGLAAGDGVPGARQAVFATVCERIDAALEQPAPPYMKAAAAVRRWLAGDGEGADAVLAGLSARMPRQEVLLGLRVRLLTLASEHSRALDVTLDWVRRNPDADRDMIRQLVFDMRAGGRISEGDELMGRAFTGEERALRDQMLARAHLGNLGVAGADASIADPAVAAELARRVMRTQRKDEGRLLLATAQAGSGDWAGMTETLLALYADPVTVAGLAAAIPLLERAVASGDVSAAEAYEALPEDAELGSQSVAADVVRRHAMLRLAARDLEAAAAAAGRLPEEDLLGRLVRYECLVRTGELAGAVALADDLEYEMRRRGHLANQGGRTADQSRGIDLAWESPIPTTPEFSSADSFDGARYRLRLAAGGDPREVVTLIQRDDLWRELGSSYYSSYFGGETREKLAVLSEEGAHEAAREVAHAFDPSFTWRRRDEVTRLLLEERWAEAAFALEELVRASCDRGWGHFQLLSLPHLAHAHRRAGTWDEFRQRVRATWESGRTDLVAAVLLWNVLEAERDLAGQRHLLEELRVEIGDHQTIVSTLRRVLFESYVRATAGSAADDPEPHARRDEIARALGELHGVVLTAGNEIQKLTAEVGALSAMAGQTRRVDLLGREHVADRMAEYGVLGPLRESLEARIDGRTTRSRYQRGDFRGQPRIGNRGFREQCLSLWEACDGPGIDPAERERAIVTLRGVCASWLDRRPEGLQERLMSLLVEARAARFAARSEGAGADPSLVERASALLPSCHGRAEDSELAGMLMLELGEAATALAQLDHAHDLRYAWRQGGDTRIMVARARALKAAGRVEEARKLLDQVVAREPEVRLTAADREVLYGDR